MDREARYDFTEIVAEEVLRRHPCAGALPVDIMSIAEKNEISVLPKPSASRGVSGMLIRLGEKFAIGYATHLGNEGFERFSVAHELGHYFLAGHVDSVLANGDVHESRAGFAAPNRYEREADHFAAALLMPRAAFKAEIAHRELNLKAIEELSALCRSSFLATAIRLAQLSDDYLAVVVSSGNNVNYCFMSKHLRDLDGMEWIHKHDLLPAGSATAAFNGQPDRVRAAERVEESSRLQDWFGGKRELEIREDVIGLGRFERTLTLLHGFDVSEEEEEEEEALLESWTPRFRR